MATAGVARASAAPLPPAHHHHHHHHQLLHHDILASSQPPAHTSCPPGPAAGTRPFTSSNVHLQESDQAHHHDHYVLPAKPQPTAQHHDRRRRSSAGQIPLTEHNVALLERQQGSPVPMPHSSPRQQSPRAHADFSPPQSTGRVSRHSLGRHSGLVPPSRLATNTPRALSTLDLEKQVYLKNDSSSGEHYYSTYSEDDLEDSQPEPRTYNLRALLHLAFTAPFLSLAIMVYTVLVLVYTCAASVAGVCVPGRPSFRVYTTSFLAGPLHLQLGGVNASATVVHMKQEKLAKRLGSLILTHLLSPLASLPMMFAAWVVAFFWALSALVADEGSNGDGKTLAMTLANWWLWWLEGRAFR